jgi:hypothetical protein
MTRLRVLRHADGIDLRPVDGPDQPVDGPDQ